MPRLELLMTATLIGMLLMTQVASSWLVFWKQPSPSIDQTALSGRPTFAPIAAGPEQPMAPRPPELSQVQGCSYLMNCADHIWCCPTPATKIESEPEISPMREMTFCGAVKPSSVAVQPSG